MKNISKRMRLDKYNLSIEIKDKLDSIEYKEEDFSYIRSQICKYLKNNLPLEYLILNWKEIKGLGRDSSSLKSYILRYGEVLGTQLYTDKIKACVTTTEDMIERYGESNTKEMLSSRGASLSNYIKRHGQIEGEKRWNEYCEKRKNTYKINRGSYASRNLEWFQKKYGEEEGYRVWKEKCKKQAYKVSRDYYIDQFGKELGDIKCRNNKARDLNFFIKKYGIDKGTEKYCNMIQKKVSNLKSRKSYSIWSQEICDIIKDTVLDLFYYGKNEMIWQLPEEYQLKLGQRIISPDLFYRGKVIEFHGDVMHGNPLLYESDKKIHPFTGKTVSELNKIDAIRKEYYESKGYDVLEVWEHDYKTNPEETVKKCLTFLK